ncbi:MAG: MBL fold metallo-hydrolase, partial [Desulfobacterales bacterium]|nr:MBL fold metallo-hydrolase [Desulfobacterales bacterium]
MVECVDGGYAATYLIQEKNGWVVVDPGTRLAADLAAARIGKAPVSLICATHFHVDHIGGIERLLTYYPNAAVMFSAGAMPFAGGLEPLPVPVFRRWILGLIPTAARLGHPLRNLYQCAVSARAGILLPFTAGEEGWDHVHILARLNREVYYLVYLIAEIVKEVILASGI